MAHRIFVGDCRKILAGFKDNSAHCVVTSPPYFGLRDYGAGDQLGMENSPQDYVQALVAVFQELRRVLREDGTCWLNLGDSYAGSGKGGNPGNSPHIKQKTNFGSLSVRDRKQDCGDLAAKQLIGIPWRVALALQQDGWYLRQDIIWAKPNPMPESVRNRCTKAHEYIFMLTKSADYYFDADAIKEDSVYAPGKTKEVERAKGYYDGKWNAPVENSLRNDSSFKAIREKRNKRSVWVVPSKPFKEAHFATFPPALIEPCVLAGSPPNGFVLDPFAGAGTTGVVAKRHGRHFVGIELNPAYAEMAERRILAENQLPSPLPPKEGTP